MTVLAMRVTKTEAHPNADALRVYQLVRSEGDAPTQIVANLELQPAVGDVMLVALAGSTLKDGTVIKRVRLRGVDSFGMFLGPTKLPVGTDASADHERPVADPSLHRFVAWPSIEQLHQVRVHLAQHPDGPPLVTYRGKVKLDGTNAGVQLLRTSEGVSVAAQSRTRVITADEDNYGFAAWVDAHRDRWETLASAVLPPEEGALCVVFGEWVGPGVQRGVAVSAIPQRAFVVYAAQHGDHVLRAAAITIEPDALSALLAGLDLDAVHVLPWFRDAVEFDFGDRAALERAADRVNGWVADVEQRDPWVADVFGVEGVGEGIVLYPVGDADRMDRDRLSERIFKAKGEKHRVVRKKKPAQLDPEVAKSAAEFVELVATEARLAQGLAAVCPDGVDIRKLGDFLKWVAADVRKECQTELDAAGLTWKQVSKPLNTAAKAFFLARR